MNDRPEQSFADARREAMNETDCDALVLRAEAAGIDAKVSSGSSMILQIDKGIGKQFVMALWLSALIAGAALIGLIATCFFIYATIGHVAVLQYDLFDLRAKTGYAHENTPPPTQENSN